MSTDGEKSGTFTKEQLKESQAKINDCLLSSSYGLAGGVVGGIFFGIRRRNLANFIIFVSVGAVADIAYGYTVSCKKMISEYEAANKAFQESESKKP